MVKQLLARLGILGIAILLASTSASAQRRPGSAITATGAVTDLQAGTPLNGALIEFPRLRRQTVTDSAGRFQLAGLRPGRQQMVVTQIGYRPMTQNLELRDDEFLVITLEPDPIALKGLEVQIDRLKARRASVAVAVEAYDRDALVSAPTLSAAEFLRNRLFLVSCDDPARRNCLVRRGMVIQPMVYIDERRALGGLQELDLYPSHDIYLIEAYEQGRMIRVYTTFFMHKLARSSNVLQQVIIW